MMNFEPTNTNQMIETLTGNITVLEQDEIAFLEYVAENGPTLNAEQAAFLKDRIRSCTDFLNENISLLNKITEVKEEGHLKFLDVAPYRIAILRLQAAIQQAKGCAEKSD